MKIAYLLSMKRGLPAFTYREIKELINLGHEVHCFVFRNGKGQYLPDPSWQVMTIQKLDFLLTILGFIVKRPKVFLQTLLSAISENALVHLFIGIYFSKYVSRYEIDVIYCFEGLHGLWIGYFCNLITKVPMTVIVHAEMVSSKMKPRLTKHAIDRCHEMITISAYNKKRITEQFQVPEHKIKVVRLFADFKQDRSLKILIVGQWTMRKGHETLLKAVRDLESKDFTVWVVGGEAWGGESFDVKEYAERLKLQDRVVFWGKVAEELLTLLYENCDIFCLPSRTTASGNKEGIPVALMEAMYFAKPVISTLHTGIPELVPEILIEENDHKALAEALLQLKSAELRQQLGEKNKKIIEERYSKANIKKIVEVLDQCSKTAEQTKLS